MSDQQTWLAALRARDTEAALSWLRESGPFKAAELSDLLFSALGWGAADVVAALLERGASATRRTAPSAAINDAVRIAAALSHPGFLRRLLAAGACATGELPARDEGPKEERAARRLGLDRSKRSLPVPLEEAIDAGRSVNVELLLQHGVPAGAPFPSGDTPALRAAKVSAVEILRILVAHGASLSERQGKFGSLPLVEACRGSTEETVVALLELGAPLHAIDGNQRSALAMAQRMGRPALVDLLLAHGSRSSRQPPPTP